MDDLSLAHSRYNRTYHIVFIPKYSVADFSVCPIVAPLVCHGVALYTVF